MIIIILQGTKDAIVSLMSATALVLKHSSSSCQLALGKDSDWVSSAEPQPLTVTLPLLLDKPVGHNNLSTQQTASLTGGVGFLSEHCCRL